MWVKTRDGRKKMSQKWLRKLYDEYPALAAQAIALNTRDNFIMHGDKESTEVIKDIEKDKGRERERERERNNEIKDGNKKDNDDSDDLNISIKKKKKKDKHVYETNPTILKDIRTQHINRMKTIGTETESTREERVAKDVEGSDKKNRSKSKSKSKSKNKKSKGDDSY